MTHPRPIVIGLDAILLAPHVIARDLLASKAIYGLVEIDVPVATRRLVTYRLTLEPWAATAAEGYPIEQVAISVWANGHITAVPVDPAHRQWLHRYPVGQTGDLHLIGQLCLWFPEDPRQLRWEWSDGLVTYITIVHRHLQAEEFWRRTGRWPAEDAPHGAGDHPVRTPAMQTAAARMRHDACC